MQNEQADEDLISVSDYIFYDKDQVMKTEAYYVTKTSQIKGFIQLHQYYLYFEPSISPEANIVN